MIILLALLLRVVHLTISYDPVGPKPQFSVALTRKFFELYLTITCDTKAIANWTCGWCVLHPGVKVVGFADDDPLSGESNAYVATYNRTVLVVFQGSHNLPNWLYDFDFPKIPYPPVLGSYVHQGFYDGFYWLQPQMRNLTEIALSKHCIGCTEIVVIGHSYGGALALLQALDLARYAPLALAGVNYSVDLWNWGQPRVGDATFADAVSLERANGGLLRAFYRSTHLEDPVPHLPFILFGFYHAAVEKYNNVINGTSYRNCTGGEDPNCADSNHFFDPAQHLTYWGLNQYYGPHSCLNK